MASEQNFSERLSSLLSHGKKGKLAAFCAVEPSTVSRWLNGSTVPNSDSLFKIAQFLGVNANFLMGGETAGSFECPKDLSVRETAHPVSESVLRDDGPPYQTKMEMLEERVGKLEAALRAIKDTIANL